MEQRPQNPQQKRMSRVEKRRRQRVRFILFSCAFVFALSGAITAIIEVPKMITQVAQSESAAAASSAPPQTAPEAERFGPILQTEFTYTAPTAALLALPENGRVDTTYFDNAILIGDSLTAGMRDYASGVQNATNAGYVGVGPRQLMSGTVKNRDGVQVKAIDEILAAGAKKVYILLGTNTLSSLQDDSLIKYYSDFLDYLSPQMPADTVYYLQAIPPVTAEKSASDGDYNNTRIQGINERIAQLAYKRNWHFVDLHAALADESGNLRGELVSGNDGIHLNMAGYTAWTEYLITHTAYSKDSPYIASSPYKAVA